METRMARKKVSPVPVSPWTGKRFLLDSKLQSVLRSNLIRAIQGRGGILVSTVDASLDYLVLEESRRSSPGKSQAERAVAALTGATIAVVYADDLPAMLLPSREEVLVFLHSGVATPETWNAMVPVYHAKVQIDLARADLSGLDLSKLYFSRCDLDG